MSRDSSQNKGKQQWQVQDGGCAVGNSLLVRKIANRIAKDGPINFSTYMDMVLYDPEYGYYESDVVIGWDGDFYTSEDISSIYGELIGKQLLEAVELISSDGPVTIVEMGPGRGTVCRDVLGFLEREFPAIRSKIRYILIERSAKMVKFQRNLLHRFLADGWPLSWSSGLENFLPEGIEGIVFSNELIDALPVHRIINRAGTIQEYFVTYKDGKFVEFEGKASGEVEEHVRRFVYENGIVLKDSMRAEVNLNAVRWMQLVGRVLKKGIAVTVDYGYPSYELYSAKRSDGTLLCYVQHQISDSPYNKVGYQDITSHVDFTALALVGEESGLSVTGFTNQQSFLLGLGIAEKTTGSNEAVVGRLIHPDGLGKTHKVLIQHAGMPAPRLAGLKYRPFFSSSMLKKGAVHVGG